MSTSHNVYPVGYSPDHWPKTPAACFRQLEQQRVTKQKFERLLAALTDASAAIGALWSMRCECAQAGVNDARDEVDDLISQVQSVHDGVAALLGRLASDYKSHKAIEPSRGRAQ